jgi:hypothetical protein
MRPSMRPSSWMGHRPPDAVDRIVVGVCAAIWLLALVVGVIATVGLVNLGRGSGDTAAASPWLLYPIIAVSALVIAGAVPLLLRARRTADAPAPTESAPQPSDAAPTEKMRVFGSTVDSYAEPPIPHRSPLNAEADRVSLRGTVATLSAMGIALTAVGAATFLLAAGEATAAWVAFAMAAGAALVMPATTVAFTRKLDAATSRVPPPT